MIDNHSTRQAISHRECICSSSHSLFKEGLLLFRYVRFESEDLVEPVGFQYLRLFNQHGGSTSFRTRQRLALGPLAEPRGAAIVVYTDFGEHEKFRNII